MVDASARPRRAYWWGVERGGAGALAYFEAMCCWAADNMEPLRELFVGFVAETGSAMEFNVFRARMFNETKAGRAAAEKFLTR